MSESRRGRCRVCGATLTIRTGQTSVTCSGCGTHYARDPQTGRWGTTTLPAQAPQRKTLFSIIAIVAVAVIALLIGFVAGRASAPHAAPAPITTEVAAAPTTTPAATATNTPTATVVACDMEGWAEAAGYALIDFLDATETALGAPRISASNHIANMQIAHRAFERTDHPSCAETARDALLEGMEYAIDTMQAWSANKDSEAADYLRLAGIAFYNAADEILALTGGAGFVDTRLTNPAVIWGDDVRGELIANGDLPTSKPSPTTEPAVASRENPIGIGYVLVLSDWGKIGTGATVRPADRIIAAENQFNPQPAPGNEYIMVGIVIECTRTSEPCDARFDFDYDLVGGSGRVYKEVFGLVIPYRLEGEAYTGGELEGFVAFEVPKSEADLLLRLTLRYDRSYTEAFLVVPPDEG